MRASHKLKREILKMENRKHPRIVKKNISVDLADGTGFFSGTISDFSRFGFCVTDIPEKLNVDVNLMTVVVSDHDKRFRINVKPRWSKKVRHKKSLGAEILDAQWGWTEFVMNFEALSPPNLLGGVRI